MGEVEPPKVSEAPKEHGERRRRRSKRRGGGWLRHLPLALFALIVCGGPLLFGAVDRPVQIALAALLAAGFALRPPMALSARAKWIALAVAAVVLLAQFGPWHTETKWRSVLGGDLRVQLPFTSHPEPARAVDALLAAVVALLWFGWVRALAADRETRVRMFWILAGAGVAIAVVCFIAKGQESGKIYGVRETLGWVGWGPFPNRNHTASFLAMAALVAAGVICWSVAKGRRVLIGGSALAFLAIVAALLMSKSRGGLVAFGAGLLVFMVAIVWRHRDRRAWGIVLGFGSAVLALILVFGGKLLERFTSQEAGAVSNDLRRQIWADTTAMWRDAPVFGHGVETFPQLFPIYTARDFDGQMVKHSESSWLLWLAELGALPLALLAGAVLVFFARGAARAWRSERRSFYLTAGAAAGVAALAAHAVFDVPGHRWATAGFALALLAVAFPAPDGGRMRRRVSLVPLAIAAFWTLPFFLVLAWSPAHLARLEAREAAARSPVPVPQVPRSEWEKVLRYFPLDPMARHWAGIAALAENPPDVKAAERHHAVARRLAGSSWGYPVGQARAYGRRFPGQALVAWQDAIDRSGRRRWEVLRGAVSETAGYPGFWVLWGQFVERRPELALAYARALLEEVKTAPDQARYYFDLWRDARGAGSELTEQEIADFYIVARSFGDAEMLAEWMEAHEGRWETDYKQWARLLADWSKMEEAWGALSRVVLDRPLGKPPGDSKREVVESQYRASPENPHLALTLAQHLAIEGKQEQAEEIILRHAQREDAPVLFLRKGGHILAGRGDFAGAVALVLREK